MTPAAYRAALARLGLTPASKATAEAFGISVRHAQRLASGERAVPEFVQIIIKLREDVKRLAAIAAWQHER